MKKILVAALFALGFSVSANAADMPVRGPVYKAAPVAPVFNWTGFYVGGHVGYGTAEDNGGNTADGFLGGIQAGVNYQFSRNWVIGFEADYAWSDVSNAVANIPYVATIRGRLGYAFNNVLVYGTAGYGFTTVDPAGIDGDGLVVGAGIEWAFNRNWSAKIEYMFHDFDFGAPGTIDMHTFKLGVNYRFGW